MAINGTGVRVDEPILVPLLDHSSSNVDLVSKTTDQELDLSFGQRYLIESKKLWHIVGPAIFSRIASYSMFVITQAFAGHLGDLELAAISIATSVIVGFDFGLLVQSFLSICSFFTFKIQLLIIKQKVFGVSRLSQFEFR